MIYSEEEIMRQLRLGEDSDWEFKQIEFAENKPRNPKRDDLANEIAAFANANGGRAALRRHRRGRDAGHVARTDGRVGLRPGRGKH